MPGFLELFLCRCLCMYLRVCPLPRLLITSGIMLRDIDPILLVEYVLWLLYGSYSQYH